METKNNLRKLVAKSGMKHNFIADIIDVSHTAFRIGLTTTDNQVGVFLKG